MSPNSSKDRSSQTGPTPGIDKTAKIESKNAVKDTVPVASEVEVDGTSIVRRKTRGILCRLEASWRLGGKGRVDARGSSGGFKQRHIPR